MRKILFGYYEMMNIFQRINLIKCLGQKPGHIRLNELKHNSIKIRQNLEEVARKGRIKEE